MSAPPGGGSDAVGKPTVASGNSAVRDFANALRNWATVMGTLMVRHFDGKSRAGRLSIIVLLAEPFILVLAIYFYRAIVKDVIAQYGTSLLLFLVSGVLPFYMFVRTSLYARRGQGNPAQRLPRINTLDIFMAGATANALLWTVIIGATFVGMWLYGIQEARPVAIEQCAISLFLMFAAGAGFGLTNAAITRFFPLWQILIGFATRGMMFLSGVVHIGDFYRIGLREWVVWNPMFHGVEWFRIGVYGRYPAITLDRAYLIKCAIIFLFIGLVADRATLRYGRK